MSSSRPSTATKIQEQEERNRKREKAKIDKFFIPEDQEEWEELARKAPCHNIWRLDPLMMASGSETTDTQFICYRALCTGIRNREDFDKEKASFGITDDIWDAAGEAMKESPELDRFLKLLHASARIEDITEHDVDWPGSWVATKSFGEKITLKGTKKRKREEAPKPARSTSRSASSLLSSFSRPAHRGRLPSIFPTQQTDFSWLSVDSHPSIPAQGKGTYPDVDDEQTVNTFAVLLLEQAGRLFGHHVSRWTMDRVPLKASFDTRNFRAYTDGALRPNHGPLIHAALEVKRSVRSSIPLPTTKQETSQIVGMKIGGHPPIFKSSYLSFFLKT